MAFTVGEPIRIVPYDADWPRAFAERAMPIRASLAEVAVRIDHIGSTAVPGLSAKPIIDIQISVADLDPLDDYRVPLVGLGYRFRAGNAERTKRYFREPAGERRTHIHVRRAGSFSEQFALLFRDYLRAHPAAASEYGALKLRLAELHRDDRRAYTDAKVAFTWEVIRSADGWAQAIGWTPQASDA